MGKGDGGVDPAGTAALFRGVNQLALDSKGRLAIPAKHRAGLVGSPSDNGKVILTADPSHCLLVYPLSTWEPIQAELMVPNRCAIHVQRNAVRPHIGTTAARIQSG